MWAIFSTFFRWYLIHNWSHMDAKLQLMFFRWYLVFSWYSCDLGAWSHGYSGGTWSSLLCQHRQAQRDGETMRRQDNETPQFQVLAWRRAYRSLRVQLLAAPARVQLHARQPASSSCSPARVQMMLLRPDGGGWRRTSGDGRRRSGMAGERPGRTAEDREFGFRFEGPDGRTETVREVL
jgi:hypothetical protein